MIRLVSQYEISHRCQTWTDIELFYRFKYFFLQYPVNFSLKRHILVSFLLEIVVHKLKLQSKIPLLIKTLCLDIGDNIW